MDAEQACEILYSVGLPSYSQKMVRKIKRAIEKIDREIERAARDGYRGLILTQQAANRYNEKFNGRLINEIFTSGGRIEEIIRQYYCDKGFEVCDDILYWGDAEEYTKWLNSIVVCDKEDRLTYLTKTGKEPYII